MSNADGYYKNKKTGGKKLKSYSGETIEDVLNYPCDAIESRGITKKTAVSCIIEIIKNRSSR